MDDMPLTVEHFLLVEPEIRALRRRLDYTPPEAHRTRAIVEQQLADLTELQRQRWFAGEAGWMTADEARSIAALLTEEADGARIDARAEVRGGRLVFSGGRLGEHQLDLMVTSPVRARAVFTRYLERCPVVRLTLFEMVFGRRRGPR